jgi:hypothetical protein
MVKSTETDDLSGVMGVSSQAHSTTTTSRAKVSMSGMTAVVMKVTGKIIKWMAMVYSPGLTAGNTKVSIKPT